MQLVISDLTDHKNAGTAISFATTDLGSFEMLLIAYKIKHCHARWHITMNNFIVEKKLDHVQGYKLHQKRRMMKTPSKTSITPMIRGRLISRTVVPKNPK